MWAEKQDSDEQFIKIYMQFKTPVYYLALSILNDAALAEDIMQETFIRVRANTHKYNSLDNIRTWIMKITRNLSYNCLRDRRFEILIDEQVENDIRNTVNIDKVVTDSIMINDLLQTLNDEEKQIFTLHVFGDYTHREISEIMNIPQGTVRWKYAIMKKTLRELLKKY